MINSVESENIWQNITLLLGTNCQQTGNKGSLYILMKNIYKNPTINISVIDKNWNTFFLKSEKR